MRLLLLICAVLGYGSGKRVPRIFRAILINVAIAIFIYR